MRTQYSDTICSSPFSLPHTAHRTPHTTHHNPHATLPDAGTNSSRALTLDLTQFDLEDEPEAQGAQATGEGSPVTDREVGAEEEEEEEEDEDGNGMDVDDASVASG